MSQLALEDLLRRGDDAMRTGQYKAAQAAYQQAWPLARGTKTTPGLGSDVARVWLLTSLAYAGVRAGDFGDAFDACAGAQQGYAKRSGVVAGNPFFHLVAALAAHGLGEERVATDNFARALICGGPAIFSGEDPAHLARMTTLLLPPAELGTWEGYEGSSRDLLNGATGYLAELLTQRLGSPPPWR